MMIENLWTGDKIGVRGKPAAWQGIVRGIDGQDLYCETPDGMMAIAWTDVVVPF